MKDRYLYATIDLLKAGHPPAETIEGLKRTLKKHGHLALLPNILRSLLRELEASGEGAVLVTIAREEDTHTLKNAIADAIRTLAVEGNIETRIDDTIVGGFIATGGGRTIDASYKRQLATLYRSLTN